MGVAIALNDTTAGSPASNAGSPETSATLEPMAQSSDPARYGRSFADVYDDWYRDLPAEPVVEFVRTRLKPHATILELGVGTGRVALPLAAAGFRVIGMDSSAEMLAQLRAKDPAGTVEPLLADAADPSAYPAADAVLAVFNLLFNLTTRRAQLACLQGCAASIGPEGLVVIESWVPVEMTDRRVDLVTRSVDPGRVVLIATDARPDEGVIHGGHIEITEHGFQLRPWTVRTLTPARLDDLAAEAGLELVERFEDFDGTPFTVDSPAHVSVYRRAAGSGAPAATAATSPSNGVDGG